MTYEDHRFACLVHDISEKGMFLICNYHLEIGQELEVRFELDSGIDFQARIQVRHFDNGCFGAQIVEVDPQANSALKRFLETRFSGQSKLPERRTRM